MHGSVLICPKREEELLEEASVVGILIREKNKLKTRSWRKMFAKLKKIGTKAYKVQLTVDLKELTITEDRDDIELICVELSRGAKSISSSTKLWPESSQHPIYFDEQLTIIMTIYKDFTGRCVQKKGTLYLNGHSNATSSVLRLGSADLKLHLMASDFSTQKLELELYDSDQNAIGILHANAKMKFLGDGYTDADDEVSSNISGETGKSGKSGKSVKSIKSVKSTKSVKSVKGSPILNQRDIRFTTVYRDNTGINFQINLFSLLLCHVFITRFFPFIFHLLSFFIYYSLLFFHY